MGSARKRPRNAGFEPARVTAVVLAAGSSVRMGRPKPLVPVLGQPLLARVLGAIRASHVGETVVVLGSEAQRVRRAIDLRGATVVVNPEHGEGMGSSLRWGAEAASATSRGLLVVLGDQPFVDPATVNALINRHAAGDGKIWIPTYEGVRGNPILLDRGLVPELCQLGGDIGCRAIFPGHLDEIRELAVRDPGILIDVDTPEEVERIERALHGQTVPTREALQPLVADRIAFHREGPVRALPRFRIRPDILALANELERAQEPFALATVVSVRSPTSGKPGFKALIRPNREVTGWVGGSCTGRVLVAEALQAMNDGMPRLIRLSPDAEEGAAPPPGVVTRRLECESGGMMEIYVEPHVPEPSLVIVGEAPVAKALAALGGFLGFRVTVVAPGARASDFPDGIQWEPDLDRVPGLVTPETFVVVASTGMYDETALKALLPRTPRYVGLVASRRRGEAVVDSLKGAGFSANQLGRIRYPAGIDIAARDPEEIALSILSEITRNRRTASVGAVERVSSPVKRGEVPSVDPVCGMEVEASAPLRATHAGVVYRFCSEGCLAKFEQAPQKYAVP